MHIGQEMIVKQIGITDKTYYQWSKDYDGLKVYQAL